MWKRALLPYIKDPESFPIDEVVFHDDNVVIVSDKFPKSEMHLLIIPKDLNLTKLHPTTGLTYKMKDSLEKYVDKSRDIIYDSFFRKYSLLKSNVWFDEMTDYNDKETFIEKFIQVGVHSVPSMSNLHIHVMTKDFHSQKMKNKKHYNSFNTEFFVLWEKLPLQEIPDSKDMETVVVGKSDLICTYCGQNFQNKFSLLKKHLEEEFNDHFTKR